MNIFRSLSLWSGAVLLALFLSSCSEEKKERLPDLAPIELPKDVPGVYSGVLPCDDCTSRMIRMNLKDDYSVEVIQTLVKETTTVDSLKGVFVVTDSTVKVTLSGDSVHWNFKRIPSGNLSFLTGAGTIYEDENGIRADFIRILNIRKD